MTNSYHVREYIHRTFPSLEKVLLDSTRPWWLLKVKKKQRTNTVLKSWLLRLNLCEFLMFCALVSYSIKWRYCEQADMVLCYRYWINNSWFFHQRSIQTENFHCTRLGGRWSDLIPVLERLGGWIVKAECVNRCTEVFYICKLILW